jgi:hypothetical protein
MLRVRIAELDEGREQRDLERAIAERVTADQPEPAVSV